MLYDEPHGATRSATRVLMAMVLRHRAHLRRPVRAVLVLRALLQERHRREHRRGDRAVRLLRHLRRDRQRRRLALRRPDRRRPGDARRPRSGGAHPACLAVGHDPDPPGHRHGAVGAGVLRHRVAAAGTPRCRRAAARAGAARAQHLGGVSRPGRRRRQRRLADRPSWLRRAQLGRPRLAGRGDRAQRLGRPAHRRTVA